MKIIYQQMKDQIIKPLQQWIRKIINNRDDDDNSFNHPWAIF